MQIIITHDNTMAWRKSISQQLREWRLERGLSLSEVARRAGSSAATISRYEHGWTRFETYTLRKLALALDCDLVIELRPRKQPAQKTPDRRDACTRLSRLFWDHPLTPDDFDTHSTWVVERVLEYGDLSDVHLLRDVIGRDAFLAAAASAQRLSPRTRTFWSQILDMEGIPCTKRYSRNTAWIS